MIGIAMVLVQMAANYGVMLIPSLKGAVVALGGWWWTALGFAVLAAMALTVDYWKVVRPLHPRLSTASAIAFLMISNAWTLEASLLLKAFNATTLFPSCYDTKSGKIIDTFSEPRPTTCEELSD